MAEANRFREKEVPRGARKRIALLREVVAEFDMSRRNSLNSERVELAVDTDRGQLWSVSR